MQAATLPGRSYLIGVAASLATAWIVIVDRREPDPQRVRQPRGVGDRLVDRGAEHRRPARRGHRRARPGRDRHRRPTGHGAAGDQDRGAAAAHAVGRGRCSAISSTRGCGPTRTSRRRSRCCSASSPARADHLRGADRAGLGRHRLLGARDLLRRGRRRPRLRLAEDRVEPGQRHHPARRQVDQAGRRHHRRRQLRLGRYHGRALHLGRQPRRPRVPDPERGLHHPAGDQLDVLQRPGAHRHQVRRELRQRSAPGAGRGDRGGGERAARAQATRRRPATSPTSATPRSTSPCGSGSAIRTTGSAPCAAP